MIVKPSDKSTEKRARRVRCVHNVSLTTSWKFKHKMRGKETGGVASARIVREHVPRVVASRSCATPDQDFLQKWKICVTDEIVLMDSASSLTRPREKQREEEAATGGEKPGESFVRFLRLIRGRGTLGLSTLVTYDNLSHTRV